MRAKALMNGTQSNHVTHVVFLVNLPVQAAQSTFVGFQGEPWVSCHIEELRPIEEGSITVEGAQGVPISKLFYGGMLQADAEMHELERQESDLSSNVEAALTIENTRSIEMDEEQKIEENNLKMNDLQIVSKVVEGKHNADAMEVEDIKHEELIESISSTRESIEEPMQEDIQQSEEEEYKNDSSLHSSVEETANIIAVNYERDICSEMYTQCVRLNSCIQAAASCLQDSTMNKHRAAERVRLLINVIPQKPVFPLGNYYSYH